LVIHWTNNTMAEVYYGSGLLVVEFAFNELHLHRVEAGVMLDNIGSMRVLERLGFHK
jgi:RimJ/RimL family protein N-acetyltransferase